ncbi:hypothetical protein [Massilia endophytica]|uniref:hypothetical protein n=1 Tax=Massilia endophytica TaxID=2899220 RepID=UPI001E65BCED|nr:hypothetical protein [Massilia endophytica]UGQ45657.1 hypothetical protein LSQ66_17970 [Massilia endophytica]
MTSHYGRAEGEPPLSLPIAFIVRQTYLTLTIQSFTASQTGESRLEALMHSDRTGATRLLYIYELKNKYPGKRELVNGAGDLLLAMRDSILEGDYWTDSPSHGTIWLHRVSKKCGGAERFEDIAERWPDEPQWRRQGR